MELNYSPIIVFQNNGIILGLKLQYQLRIERRLSMNISYYLFLRHNEQSVTTLFVVPTYFIQIIM